MMDLFSAILAVAILILVFWLFVRLRRRGRGSGAAMFMISQGAMDAFLNNDKKRATEIIVERNAGKKMEEQSAEGNTNNPSDDPERTADGP